MYSISASNALYHSFSGTLLFLLAFRCSQLLHPLLVFKSLPLFDFLASFIHLMLNLVVDLLFFIVTIVVLRAALLVLAVVLTLSVSSHPHGHNSDILCNVLFVGELSHQLSADSRGLRTHT